MPESDASNRFISTSLPTERFVSYAQNGEDVMLFRALRGLPRGFYIDVGAGDPEADSVTCAFYQRGWYGINLEPAPGTFERLAAARPRDINLKLAAGDRNGTIGFFVVDGGNGLSTTEARHVEMLRKSGWDVDETEVPVRTLASIVAEHGRGDVHFLKVDTEGGERAVLAGADLRRFRPWIILIEATEPNTQITTHHTWEDLLIDADYHFVWYDGLNRFYLAAEKRSELEGAFRVQPNVFDGFVRRADALTEERLAETAAELARISDEAHEELARVSAERDAWMQDLFESNRYAADLVQARQTLTDEVARLRAKRQRRFGRLFGKDHPRPWKQIKRGVRWVARRLGRR